MRAPAIRVFLVLVVVVGALVALTQATEAVARTQSPRVRREWRSLSASMRFRVAAALWTLKTTPTKEGRDKYGPHFNNYDELLMLHACAVYDPRCDVGHFGTSFMTFHRAFLLKMERALLSVDAGIGALPYWHAAFDAVNGTYRNNPDKYIFTCKYFGDWKTKAAEGYAVKNGLFADWPVAEFTSDKYGKSSWLAPANKCVREEWFSPLPCNSKNPKSTRYIRNHLDCTPTVARNENDVVLNQGAGLGGSTEIVYTDADFKACSSFDNVKSWMDWQNCVEMGVAACLPVTPAELATVVSTKVTFPPVFRNCTRHNLMGTYIDKNGKIQLVNFFHSMVHIKTGLDLADVTTSPNDPGPFTGHHANVDRNNMIWQKAAAKRESTYWNYPASRTSLQGAGRSNLTVSGPYAVHAASSCSNNSIYPEYHATDMWTRGTTLDEVVNRGFPFTNLFDCTADAVDKMGHRIRCTGEPGGYTHREILYWTAPGRTPYTYDVMS
eukprot:Opistho-2@73390